MEQSCSHIQELTRSLSQLRREGYLCDTVLVAEDGQLKAHSAVLAAASPVFKAALKSGDKPVEHVIILPGMQLFVAEIILHFIYTGDIVITKQYANAMLDCIPQIFLAMSELQLKIPVAVKCVEPKAKAGVEKSRSLLLPSLRKKDKHSEHSETVKTDRVSTAVCYDKAQDAEDNHESLLSANQRPGNEGHVKRPENVKKALSGGNDKMIELSTLLCELCGEVLTSRSILAAHLMSHSDQSENGSEIASYTHPRTADEITEELNDSDGTTAKFPPVLCELCGKVFKNRSGLSAHIKGSKTHSVEKPVYTCEDCGRHFARFDNLRRHRLMHTGVRPHACQYCSQSFRQRTSLVNHTLTRHPETIGTDPRIKLLRCRHCSVSFSSSYHLRDHVQKLHTLIDKPKLKSHRRCNILSATSIKKKPAVAVRSPKFACELCEHRFFSKLALTCHIRKHTGEKPFQCSVCGRAFSQQSSLSTHMLTHTGERKHICHTCGNRFSLRATLIKHERLHTGDRPFQCTVCGKQHIQMTHLKRHMLTHSHIKPFKCTACDKSYCNRVDLRMHCSRVHRIQLPVMKRRTSLTVSEDDAAVHQMLSL